MAITDRLGGELTDDAPVGSTIASVTRRRTPVRIPTERYTSASWAELEKAALAALEGAEGSDVEAMRKYEQDQLAAWTKR